MVIVISIPPRAYTNTNIINALSSLMYLLFENTHLLENKNELSRPIKYPKKEDKLIFDVKIQIDLKTKKFKILENTPTIKNLEI